MQSNNKYRLTIWFVIFLSFLNAQENPPYKIDTIWHSNGQVQSIYEINSENQFCGFYKEFDTLGNIYFEGNFIYKDSVECVLCFDGSPQFYSTSGRWEQFYFLNKESVRIGEWKFYHSNGQIEMIGTYCDKMHVYSGTVEPYVWEKEENHPISTPVNGYISYEPVKCGQWNYFDAQGANYLTEEYVNGTLVYKIERQ